ncbi:CRASP family complement regulator-acquiring lipoprotein [Borreliella valaisiana]|uniref:CRASP family complement regulator-acquiring lipoprotein n=1 Tax=Borreliella valaisiana TaxID=62088 RepID=UPI002ED486BF
MFEELLSIKEIFSKITKQILSDYQDDKNSIQTHANKLGLYIKKITEQLIEKEKEAENLKNEILSIKTF